MNQPDWYYLQNEKIAEIFKGNNAVLTSHVFACIEKKYKKFFFSRVVVRRHYLLAEKVLAGIAEEAFNEMQNIFYNRVREDKFDTADPGISNYLFQTFSNQYRNFYRKELVHKKYALAAQRPDAEEPSGNTPVLNRPDGIYSAIRMSIDMLKPDCKDLMTLKILHSNGTTEPETPKNKHAADQQTYRCRQQLKGILKQKFGIEL